MTRTLAARGPIAPAAALASALAMLVALTGPGLLPASADQFTPLEDPPSIVVVGSEIYLGDDDSIDPDDEAFTALDSGAIIPAFPESTEIYNVFTELTTNGDLANVTEIRLCLYDSADPDFNDEIAGDQEDKIAAVCGIRAGASTTGPLTSAPSAWTDPEAAGTANFDPKKVFVIRWLADEDGEETPGFRVEQGGSTVNYEDAGSLFTPSGQEATAKFAFKVSNAMQVSSAWKIRVAAESVTDIDERGTVGQSAQDLTAGPFTVAYFGHMSAVAEEVRPAVDFGVVVPSTTSKETGIRTGHYTANDASNLTIRATDFTNGENTIGLADNGDFGNSNSDRSESVPEGVTPLLNVTSGRAALDCAFTSTADLVADAGIFVQVQNRARIFAISGITATGEALRTNLSDHTCALSYSGGAPVANVPYSNTVVIGIMQRVDEVLAASAADAVRFEPAGSPAQPAPAED
jgi:hypothetical protein